MPEGPAASDPPEGDADGDEPSAVAVAPTSGVLGTGAASRPGGVDPSRAPRPRSDGDDAPALAPAGRHLEAAALTRDPAARDLIEAVPPHEAATDDPGVDGGPGRSSEGPGDDDGSPLDVADADDEASYPAPLRHPAGRYIRLLALPLAVGVALRLGLALADDVITNDASAYLESGRNLVDGRGFTRDGGFPELHFPPGAPVFLGLAWKASGSPLFALAFVNLLFSSLCLLPIAALARRLGGDRAGLAATWIAALAPGITSVPANLGGGSESAYLFWLLVTLWLVATLPARRGPGVWATAGLAGLTAGAVYLTRPEGLLLVAVIIVVIALSSGVVGDLRARSLSPSRLVRQFGPPAVMGLAFVACLAPYLGFLHTHTGKWEVTAKTQDANLEAWRAVAGGDRRARDEVLYELDESGLRYVQRSSSLATLAMDDPAGYAGIVGVNLSDLRAQYIDPRASSPTPFPRWALLPLPLVAVALWAAWKGRRKRADLVLIGVVGLATATCLGFFVQPRYLIPAAGVLTILSGVGLAQLGARWRRWAFWGALVLLVVPVVIDIPRQGGVFDSREPVEHQIAGEWLADNAPAGARIMTRSLVTEFYSARKAVALPYGSIAETVRFAYYHGVDYLAVDEFLMERFRPQLRPLFEEGPWPGLELAHEFSYRGRLTRIFALDPPPPVDSDNPPGLGFVGDG